MRLNPTIDFGHRDAEIMLLHQGHRPKATYMLQTGHHSFLWLGLLKLLMSLQGIGDTDTLSGYMYSVQWGQRSHSTQAWLHIPAAVGACRKRQRAGWSLELADPCCCPTEGESEAHGAAVCVHRASLNRAVYVSDPGVCQGRSHRLTVRLRCHCWEVTACVTLWIIPPTGKKLFLPPGEAS